MMDVSIIIVSWNTCEVLRQCLESVMANLGGLRVEVFVVDNGSKDRSCEMVAEYFPDVILVRNESNRGFAAANNQAIREARGKYLLLLNSDTVVLKDVLQGSFRYIEQHTDVGVLGCRVLNGDGTPQLTCSRFPTVINLLLLTSGLWRLSWPRVLGRYQISDWARDTERNVDTVTGCYMFVRAKAVQEVGLLDESFFFYGEETDWCKRFWNSGWTLRFAPIGEIIHYGSLSSRQCNHRRDLMLTEGLLRYHRKHSGLLATVIVYAILALFAGSRVMFWSLRSLCDHRAEVSQRRDHFLGVLFGFRSTWPRAQRRTP